jgi:anti-sigma-K factor RskA
VSACPDWQELLGGYALGALEPDEEEAVRRHLESCPDCRQAYEELAGVTRALDTLDKIEPLPEPPPGLEQAVLERFSQERRSAPADERSPASRWRPRALALAGAGAAAVAVALVLAGVFSSSSDEQSFGHVELRGDPAGAVARAQLHKAPAGTRVELSVDGMPPDSHAVYDVWCIRDDGRWVSGGSFQVGRSGDAHVTLTAAVRAGEYEVMRVTTRSGKPGEGRYGTRLLKGKVEY